MAKTTAPLKKVPQFRVMYTVRNKKKSYNDEEHICAKDIETAIVLFGKTFPTRTVEGVDKLSDAWIPKSMAEMQRKEQNE